MYYCARPLKSDATQFYTFLTDIFMTGRISGVREERARRERRCSLMGNHLLT